MSSASPSPKTAVGSDAIIANCELGFDLLSSFSKYYKTNRKLYVFGHWEYYDSMFRVAEGIMDYGWCGKNRIAAGLNYFPMKEIVLKAEYSKRFYSSEYNDEPSISFGVAYCGFFNR